MVIYSHSLRCDDLYLVAKAFFCNFPHLSRKSLMEKSATLFKCLSDDLNIREREKKIENRFASKLVQKNSVISFHFSLVHKKKIKILDKHLAMLVPDL